MKIHFKRPRIPSTRGFIWLWPEPTASWLGHWRFGIQVGVNRRPGRSERLTDVRIGRIAGLASIAWLGMPIAVVGVAQLSFVLTDRAGGDAGMLFEGFGEVLDVRKPAVLRNRIQREFGAF